MSLLSDLYANTASFSVGATLVVARQSEFKPDNRKTLGNLTADLTKLSGLSSLELIQTIRQGTVLVFLEQRVKVQQACGLPSS